jgi:NADP-dependent aldehyde dehydrogenase
MHLKGTSIIGKDRSSGNGESFYGTDPSGNEKLEPVFYSADLTDLDRALELAVEAFQTYRKVSGKTKGTFLRRIAEELDAHKEEIIRRAHRETALPVPRLQSEMTRTCNQFILFATVVEEGSWVDARIDHGDEQRKPLPKPDVRSMFFPLGPVAVFGASNFPLAFSVAGGDTASALAAGCPVIVKAHPAHPGTSELAGIATMNAVNKCELPEGMFSLLFDKGFEIGTALVQHPSVTAVGFTGSRSGGNALMNAMTKRKNAIPFYAEMSSVNPVCVLPGALKNNPGMLAAGLHASVTLGVGQFCTNPGLIFVETGEGVDDFLDELTRLFNQSPSGVMLTHHHAALYHKGIKTFQQISHLRTLGGNLHVLQSTSGMAPPLLMATDAQTFISTPLLSSEIFGPSTLVVSCGSRNELLDAIRSLEGQLTVSVHGTENEFSDSELLALVQSLAGRIIFNGFPTGVEVCSAMHHGGPSPATSDSRWTSVGTRAIYRFVRPFSFQDCPDALLPPELQRRNPLNIDRLIDGTLVPKQA